MNIDAKVQQRTHVERLLKAAKARIASPSNWTKHAVARTAEGRSVPAKSPMAVAFDVSGAMQNVDPVIYRNYKTMLPDATLSPAWEAFRMVVRPASVSGFNDNNSHADVMDAFDRAIARVMVER